MAANLVRREAYSTADEAWNKSAVLEQSAREIPVTTVAEIKARPKEFLSSAHDAVSLIKVALAALREAESVHGGRGQQMGTEEPKDPDVNPKVVAPAERSAGLETYLGKVGQNADPDADTQH